MKKSINNFHESLNKIKTSSKSIFAIKVKKLMTDTGYKTILQMKEYLQENNMGEIGTDVKKSIEELISTYPRKFLIAGLPHVFTKEDVVSSLEICGFIDNRQLMEELHSRYFEAVHSYAKNRRKKRLVTIFSVLEENLG